MERFKFGKKSISLVLAALMVLTSIPITQVFAATKKTVDCPDCHGNKVVDCVSCTDGYTDVDCSACNGTGTVVCPDCTDGTDGEGNTCDTCNGTLEVDCTTCNGAKKEICSDCFGVGTIKCSTCDGTGKIEKEFETCPDCNGSGECSNCNDNGKVYLTCGTCYGSGIITVNCSDCSGTGVVKVACATCGGTKTMDCTNCETGQIECTTCSGTGKLADDTDCSNCLATGYVNCTACGGTQKVDCIDCDVDGKVDTTCANCNGSGNETQDCPNCVDGGMEADCPECTGNNKCIKCAGKGELETLDDLSFEFAIAAPSAIKVGDTYINAATSDKNTTGVVTYSVDDVSIATVDAFGKLTALKAGKVKVTASIATDYVYSSKEITYDITIDPATPVIGTLNVSELTYGEKLSDSTITAEAKVAGKTISGKFEWDNSQKDIVPTVVNDSETTLYNFVFTPDDNENYTVFEGKTTVKVNRADITGITVTDNRPIYNGSPQSVLKVEGTDIGDKVTYSVDNGITYTDSLELTNVLDSTNAYVKVHRDDNYNDAIIATTATILPAEIDGVKFNVYSGIYDGQEHPVFNSVGGEGYRDGDTIKYIYEGKEFDSLSFEDAGTYEFTVKISRDDKNYTETDYPKSETEATFVVVIAKKDITVTANDVEKTYADAVFGGNGATAIGLVEGHSLSGVDIAGTGITVGEYVLTPSNAVIKGSTKDVTTNYNITYNDGKLTISKADLKIIPNKLEVIYNANPYSPIDGAYTIEGLVSENHNEDVKLVGSATTVGTHNDAISIASVEIRNSTDDVTSNYDITCGTNDIVISYLELSNFEDAYEYSEPDGENGWYHNVKILAKEGYTISYQNENADGFANDLDYLAENNKIEGVNVPKIAVKDNSTGYITAITDIKSINIDTVDPTTYDIEYSIPFLKKILSTITFFYNPDVTVTIKASDETSKIDSLTYTNGSDPSVTVSEKSDTNPNGFVVDEDGVCSYSYKIDSDFEGEIKYIAKDKSGLTTEKIDSTRIVVDQTAPNDIKIGFKKTAVEKILNVLTFGVFFNDDVKVVIKAKDATSGLSRTNLLVKNDDGEEIYNETVYFDKTVAQLKSGSTEFVIDRDDIEKFQGTIAIKVYDNCDNFTIINATINDGKIELASDSVKPLDDENANLIDNYLVYENGNAHKQYSSITIKSEQIKVSNQTMQTDVDLSDYIDESYLEDDAMSFKKFAPLYNEAVSYTVAFADEYSGILNAQVIVFNNNTKTEYLNTNYNFVTDEFSDKGIWTKSNSASNEKIVESAKVSFEIKNNANDIVILAIITDNAGNISYDYYNFGIDTKKPVIDYKFTTDNTDTKSGTYYSKKTVYALEVCDRNFPVGNEIVGKITYTLNGKEKSVTLKGKDFTPANNEKSYSDNQKYSYILNALTNEGQYENFKFEAADRAGNKDSVSSKMTFYYDHTAPVVTIKDSNSGVHNGKFYQDKRVITVTVKDRYFAENLFKYNSKSHTNYKFTDSEASEKYHTNSRIFTYEFTYETSTSIDCVLNNFAATDKAGNAAKGIEAIANANDFVVDGKAPNTFSAIITTPNNRNGVSVSGDDYKVFVEDDIILTISCKDENLTHANLSSEKLICRSLTSNGTTKTTEFPINKQSNGSRNEVVYSAKNLDQDGFYEFSYTIKDDSEKESARQTITFAICRNGAMFNTDELDKITNSEEMFNAENVNEISFRQYSASENTASILEISSDSVQFPRRVLELGTDYIIEPNAVQNRETLVYTSVYKLLRKAFELENGAVLDGVYTVKVTPITKDANNNESTNAPSQTFNVTLDATDPVMNAKFDYTTSYNKVFENVIVENKEKYKFFASNVTLTFDLSDSYSGIDENSIEITWNGEELKYETNENGEYKVVLNANNNANGNEIIIGAFDKAGNQVRTSFTVKMDNNFWIYIALACFAGIGLLVLAIVLIIRKKKLGTDSAE